MTLTLRFVLTSALTLVFVGNTSADNPAESRALYAPGCIFGFFTADAKAELKITKEQEKALKASEEKRQKIWQKHVEAEGKVIKAKLPKGEQNAKLRALETKVVDELFASIGETLRPEQLKRMKQIILQVKGMEIFDYPEIREALKIGDKEVKTLHAAYDKLAHEERQKLQAAVQAKKITSEEAARQAFSWTFSVPDQVRESLSKQQKRILEDLLGEKYRYGK
jgi:hypothetical protein